MTEVCKGHFSFCQIQIYLPSSLAITLFIPVNESRQTVAEID